MVLEKWQIILCVILVVLFLVGGLSTVQKDAKKPLRKKSLNDLKETLPRSNKTTSSVDTIKTKKH